MRPVKYDEVKLRAQREANLSPYSGLAGCYALMASMEDGTHNWKDKFLELQELVFKRIAQWDIRRLRKLHELFPSCLPRTCQYIVEQDCKGNWWVVQ